MAERTGAITFKGNPMTLVGNTAAVGKPAPAFTAVGNDMKPVDLASYKGKVVILSSVPSLDTPVCDTETRRFNEEAGKLGNGVAVLTISLDLPMAQKRWCGAAGIENVKTISDYKDRSFSQAFGLYIKELGLLARAVYVIDKDGVVQYEQLVAEVTQEPDYDAVIQATKGLM
jgi:thiol peroxidase